jgi:RsiW-degrading membrane proteinase PrsW (M82 family)
MLELLLIAIVPSALLLWYIWKKDSYEPEPLHLIAWVFFLGTLVAIPAGILEMPFGDGLIAMAVIAPVVEEGLKFLVVYLAVYRHPEFDEPMDGIVYATAASLGFATIENIGYVLEFGFEVGIGRAITSVPGHLIFACIWGFALGRAKFRPASERTGIIIAGLLGGMLLHGIYNFTAGFVGFGVVLLVILPLGWWMTCRNIQSAHADPASACSAINHLQSPPGLAMPGDPLPHPQAYPASPDAPCPAGAASAKSTSEGTPRFCAHCGAPNKSVSRFCENCGKQF